LKGGFLLPFNTHKKTPPSGVGGLAYLQLVVLDSANKPLHIEKRYLDSAALGNWQELKIEYLASQNATLQVNVVNNSERTAAYFDNLTITNDPPAIVQENHYDPWGWNLVGIEVEGNPEHKWQYIDREKLEELGLNWYDLKARGYESVLGRFHSVDPDLTNQESFSTYQYGWNNPILRSDPNGLNPCCGEEAATLGMAIGQTVKDLTLSALNTGLLMTASPVRIREGGNGQFNLDLSRLGPRSTSQVFKDIGGDALDAVNTIAMVGTGGASGAGVLFAKAGTTVVVNNLVQTSKRTVYYAQKNGGDYIGSAKEGAKKRYNLNLANPSRKMKDEGVTDAVDIVTGIPDYKTQKGVEQALINLNGGKSGGLLKNKYNATTKDANERLKLGNNYLNKNYPNWKTDFKLK
jgi:RHS repeat-associated protein